MTIAALVTFLCVPAANAKPHHSRGYDTAVKLNRALAHTPMAGTGWALVEEARRFGVHPALIAAIAGTESSYGAAACRNNRFNAFGLSSCGYGWRVPAFRSWRQAYAFMARFLSERWPRARSPFDFHGYAACDSCWGRKVSEHMRRLGFPSQARWGA